MRVNGLATLVDDDEVRRHIAGLPIHNPDEDAILLQGLTDERFHGVVNGTAPEPVRFAELARALGQVLRRPAILPVPTLLLWLVLGQRAQVVLQSQRARPARLMQLGFRFQHASLPDALTQCVARAAEVSITAAHGGESLPEGVMSFSRIADGFICVWAFMDCLLERQYRWDDVLSPPDSCPKADYSAHFRGGQRTRKCGCEAFAVIRV